MEVPNDDPTTQPSAHGAAGDAVSGDGGADTLDQDFASRTAAVEQRPLEDRADRFSVLHDELRTRLESGGTTSA